jgi:hypothetical protein
MATAPDKGKYRKTRLEDTWTATNPKGETKKFPSLEAAKAHAAGPPKVSASGGPPHVGEILPDGHKVVREPIHGNYQVVNSKGEVVIDGQISESKARGMFHSKVDRGDITLKESRTGRPPPEAATTATPSSSDTGSGGQGAGGVGAAPPPANKANAKRAPKVKASTPTEAPTPTEATNILSNAATTGAVPPSSPLADALIHDPLAPTASTTPIIPPRSEFLGKPVLGPTLAESLHPNYRYPTNPLTNPSLFEATRTPAAGDVAAAMARRAPNIMDAPAVGTPYSIPYGEQLPFAANTPLNAATQGPRTIQGPGLVEPVIRPPAVTSMNAAQASGDLGIYGPPRPTSSPITASSGPVRSMSLAESLGTAMPIHGPTVLGGLPKYEPILDIRAPATGWGQTAGSSAAGGYRNMFKGMASKGATLTADELAASGLNPAVGAGKVLAGTGGKLAAARGIGGAVLQGGMKGATVGLPLGIAGSFVNDNQGGTREQWGKGLSAAGMGTTLAGAGTAGLGALLGTEALSGPVGWAAMAATGLGFGLHAAFQKDPNQEAAKHTGPTERYMNDLARMNGVPISELEPYKKDLRQAMNNQAGDLTGIAGIANAGDKNARMSLASSLVSQAADNYKTRQSTIGDMTSQVQQMNEISRRLAPAWNAYQSSNKLVEDAYANLGSGSASTRNALNRMADTNRTNYLASQDAYMSPLVQQQQQSQNNQLIQQLAAAQNQIAVYRAQQKKK